MAQILAIGAAVLSAAGTIGAGNSAKASADYQARQLKQQANAAEASGQYQAEQDRREAEFVRSRAQALAAASGAGASDKTVLDIMGRITEEGEFRALSSLWAGSEQATSARMAATNVNEEGRNIRDQSYYGALGNALGGYAKYKSGTIMDETSTLYSKYAAPYKRYSDPYGIRNGNGLN